MPVTTSHIDATLMEVRRFVFSARAARKRLREKFEASDKEIPQDTFESLARSPETAALRRASMDLTRALAALRKGRIG